MHTIWGIYAIKGKTIEYDNVSELTFRIADNIPIRMFYEQPIPFGTQTTLDTYIDRNIQDLIVMGDGEKHGFHWYIEKHTNKYRYGKKNNNIYIEKKIYIMLPWYKVGFF